MKTFILHGSKVSVSTSGGRTPKGAQKFGTEHQLAMLAAGWPASRFHEVWNALPNTMPVRKFTDRKTAVGRIWKALQTLERAAALSTRTNTKAHKILSLLTQPGGAALKAIMKGTGWQAHSVRGFISGQLVKRMKLRVQSFRRDGERVYAIKS
jgi:hypothetical protein